MSIPEEVVSNFLEFAWYIETAPLGIANNRGWFVPECWSLIPVLLLKIKLPAPWALILEFDPSCPIIKSELSPNIATGAFVLLIPLTASGNFIVSENVVTPVTFTLSKFVWPSTSKSWGMLTPTELVSKRFVPLWYNSTAPSGISNIPFWLIFGWSFICLPLLSPRMNRSRVKVR